MNSAFEKLKKYLQQNQAAWLITGVAGFIGSNLLQTLLELNQKVIGFDNFATGYQGNIDEALEAVESKLQNNFTFYEGDIRSLEDCQKIVKDVDFVLHQAALGSVPLSIKSPELTNAVNVDGFINVLLAAVDAKVKRFVYASSSAVYGDSPTLPKAESNAVRPLSPYAVSKYTNELYAKAFANCFDMQTIGLRYFNVFGCRQDPCGEYAAVIPLWMAAMLQGKDVFINGDGESMLDFCYVDDVVQANLLAATSENIDAINTVYNVAVGKRTSLNELYLMMQEKLNIELKTTPQYREFRKGDVRHSLADINKASNLLGYEPTRDIEKCLNIVINWYVGFFQEKCCNVNG